MILKEGKNIPVALAQIENMTSALLLFRSFKNETAYQMSHFILFLNTPGAERDEFYQLFAEQVTVMNNRYVKRILYNI